jgi:hypothetical protein
MGYPFRDTDLAGRFSWKFLRDADRRQVEAVMNGILAADNQQTTGSIMRAIFRNSRKHNEFGATTFDLYDGTAPGPPPLLGTHVPRHRIALRGFGGYRDRFGGDRKRH